MGRELAAERWDAEYRGGRYAEQPPVAFVDRILATLGTSPLRSSTGLYVGCGNGRNYLPLVDAGLRLYGLDLSTESLHQLAARNPAVSERLICADFRTWQSRRRFGYVIAIQVFQHGDAADVAGYFAKVGSMLDPGGLLFLRVNSTSTQILHSHTIIEQNEVGGMTVRYEAGPKRGLPVHFFTRDELLDLTGEAFDVAWMHRARRSRDGRRRRLAPGCSGKASGSAAAVDRHLERLPPGQLPPVGDG